MCKLYLEDNNPIIKDYCNILEAYLYDLPTNTIDRDSNLYKAVYKQAESISRDATTYDSAYRITTILEELGNMFREDTQLIYLQYKFKSVDRIAEKLYHKSNGKLPTYEETKELIQDSLRYTYIIEEESYIDRIDKILHIMEAEGFNIVEFENKWSCPTYKGIKVIFEKKGFRFEVQFQTLYSYIIKEHYTRIPYKVIRNPYASTEMKELADRVRIYYQSLNTIPNNAVDYIYKGKSNCKVKMK